jgi:hypothetical protein
MIVLPRRAGGIRASRRGLWPRDLDIMWTPPLEMNAGGRRVAFIGYEWTPQTYRVSDRQVVDLDGSNLRDVDSPAKQHEPAVKHALISAGEFDADG